MNVPQRAISKEEVLKVILYSSITYINNMPHASSVSVMRYLG